MLDFKIGDPVVLIQSGIYTTVAGLMLDSGAWFSPSFVFLLHDTNQHHPLDAILKILLGHLTRNK